MTREEAIKWLDFKSGDIYDHVFYGDEAPEWEDYEYEALRMVIEAFENNDKLAEDLQNCLEMYKKKKAEVEALKQTAWIPCSERLPETEVLCCDDRGEMIVGYPCINEESNTGYCAESDDCFLLDCIAWMPLPQPWKGDSNGVHLSGM